MAEQEALAGDASKFDEALGLRLVLYPFSNHIDAKPVAHGQYRPHDMLRWPIRQHGRHKRPVDFQLVEAELAKPTEARLTGAEIVERNPDTYGAQLFDYVGG